MPSPYQAPQTIIARGVNIKSVLLDPSDNTWRFDIDIHLEQFFKENKQYTNGNGWFRAQIVKRKIPSPQGHTHIMRVATSQCRPESIIPQKPNELR